VNPPALCPNCEAKLIHHDCGSSDCDWAQCPRCSWFGIPEKGVWKRPIHTKENHEPR
jgi:Zn-finger nucleic acid-binding protein